MPADDYAGLRGAFYSAYICRPRLARVVGALLWGSDLSPLYASLKRLAHLAPGQVVLDAACGAGLALGWLNPAAGHRYVGVDCSPVMLQRARLEAARRGFGEVELHLGDIASLPVADGNAHVGLIYNTLHCVPDPAAAVAAVTRCLQPGGVLVGTALVRGASRRSDWIIEHDPTMGSAGHASDLERWLEAAGLSDIDVQAPDALATFTAHR